MLDVQPSRYLRAKLMLQGESQIYNSSLLGDLIYQTYLIYQT